MSCCDANICVPPPEKLTKKGAVNGSELLDYSTWTKDGYLHIEFLVPDMHCIGCVRSLERIVGELPFVTNVRANLSLKKISVTWQNIEGKNDANVALIGNAVERAGFKYTPYDSEDSSGLSQNKEGKNMLIALAVAGFGAVNIMLLSVSIWSGADEQTTNLFHLISGIIAVPIVFYSGQVFYRSALSALRVGRLNMDVPISLAVLMALGMSIYESLNGGPSAYFDAAVTLLFFLLIGRYLDHMMREKARHSIVQLSSLASKGAMRVEENGELSYINVKEIRIGMILRIKAGERISVDGEVVDGKSDVDRSLVSGENIPVLVEPGAEVQAGTLNLNGVIDIRVVRDAEHSFLAEITRMMEAAEKGRGRFTRIADRAARSYAPVVHILAVVAFIGWMIATGNDWHASIYVAISVLIITCPCALGLAVPVVHVIAARRLFKEGIIIRDGSGFERMEEVDYVVFDKTGTLTSGVPKVNTTTIDGRDNMAIAKALAMHSNHPYSMAVASYFGGVSATDIGQITEVPGNGVEGVFNGARVRLGRYEWVKEIACDNNPKDDSNRASVFFAIENGKISGFEICEEIRDGALKTVEELTETGNHVEILSGDRKIPVATVAGATGVEQFSWNMSPVEKTDHINNLRTKGKTVLMVGDGLNDSPALVAANVSMAPASASDIARQCADFVFTRQSLEAVPFTIRIARKAGKLVRQNFALSIWYNVIAVPFAMAGYVTPLIAAIAMSASSIVVIANSMRLNSAEKYHKSGSLNVSRVANLQIQSTNKESCA